MTPPAGNNLYEAARFVIVGGLATLTDLGVSVVLALTTGLSENAVTTLAFLTAFWVSYFGHRYFTFRKKGGALPFFCLAAGTLALRNLLVWLLVLAGVRGLAALIAAMAAVTAVTYLVAKFKIFRG